MKSGLARRIADWQQRSDGAMLILLALVAVVSSLIVAVSEPLASVGGLFFTLVAGGILIVVSYGVARRILPNASHQQQAEQRLSAYEQRLRSMATALPDRVVMLDTDGWYHDVLKSEYDNSSSAHLGGKTGQHLHDAFPKEFADFCLQKVREIIATDEAQVFEYDIDFTEECYHIEGRVIPYTDPLTHEALVIWVSRDITERKGIENRLVESEKLLRTVFTALPDRTMIFDADGHYLEILQVAYKSSHNPDETRKIKVGHSIRDHFPAAFADYCIEMIHKTLDTGTMQIFSYPSPLHQDPHYFEARTIPFLDPISGAARVLWVTRDITAEQQAEQRRLELALQQEKLEFFQQFVNSMTHDLKTPLTVIETGLYFVQRAEDASRRQMRIDGIHQQVMILNNMIDDILLIGRLDALPQLQFDDVDVITLIQETAQELHPNADKKGQQFRTSFEIESAIVSAAPGELKRALTNLIDNAIKYTPDQGRVEIGAQVVGSEMVIEVRDTGIGINADDIPHIFDRFYRSDSGRLTASGTGLGLAIVKLVIELHGGRIEVQSEAGQGSNFCVRLPVQRVAAGAG